MDVVKELKAYDNIIRSLLDLKDDAMETKLYEYEAIGDILTDISMSLMQYLKQTGVEEIQTGDRELAVHESIIRNLVTIKEDIIAIELN